MTEAAYDRRLLIEGYAVKAARLAADETSWVTDHKLRRHYLEQPQVPLRKNVNAFGTLATEKAGAPNSALSMPTDGETK